MSIDVKDKSKDKSIVKIDIPCPKCGKKTDWIAKNTGTVIRECGGCSLVFAK